jgi:hypothetical protein
MSETSIWIIAIYVLIFVVMNVSGLVWLKMTAQPRVKKNQRKTIDWGKNDN